MLNFRKLTIPFFALIAIAAVACGGGDATLSDDQRVPSVSQPTTAPSTPTISAQPGAPTAGSTESAKPTPVIRALTDPIFGLDHPSNLTDDDLAPELENVSGWINTEPFTLEEQRGKVVLIDFWTYTCVNCIRTMPFIKAWHEKYKDNGLLILGVHTPEFEFEKVRENVVDAVESFGLEYPVIQDNDRGTWQAFSNRFWPAKYMIDANGFIRYTHFGEGGYDETEGQIRDLLIEAGYDLSDIPGDTPPEPDIDPLALTATEEEGRTRELYAGYNRNGLLTTNPPYVLHREFFEARDADILYSDPGEHPNHFLFLDGLWNNGPESLVHSRVTEDFEDYMVLQFYANSVNVVLAADRGGTYDLRLLMDGDPLAPEDAGEDVWFDDDGNSFVTVHESRMYFLVNLLDFSGHELQLSSNSDEFEVFAFTFGSYKGGEPGKGDGTLKEN